MSLSQGMTPMPSSLLPLRQAGFRQTRFAVTRWHRPRRPRSRPLHCQPLCCSTARPEKQPPAQNVSLTQQEALAMCRGDPEDNKPGCVYLVGTGPGDPGLLTLTAYHLLQSVDVVLYDRLVSNAILEMIHSDARMVYVGKQSSFHTRTQNEIHELMSVFAEAGSSVVRLKGGDPYIFGRGGEEMQYLRQRGIPVKCIPGITAASGISAELGIPLTHRGLATSVRFLTGHSREGGEQELERSMGKALDPNATLVIYMGLQTLSCTIKGMTENGQNPKTPSVAVERGTTDKQRAVFSHLATLVKDVADACLESPTLLIIGDVVALSQGWEDYIQTGTSLQAGRMHSYLPRAEDLSLSDQPKTNVYPE